MFRTRDFILLFVTIVFLLVAISATVFKSYFSDSSDRTMIKLVETEETEYSAIAYEPEAIARDQKLADMRRKIAEDSDLSIAAPVEDLAEEEVAESPEVTEEPTESVLLNCPGYSSYSGSWSAEGIKFEVVEGARLVYRESVNNSVVTGTSSSSTGPSIIRDVLIELPIYLAPSSNSNCIAMDVIGVAQDGSLIRNSEVNLYKVFGEQTLIGYALDGYPIYGLKNGGGDACGGVTIAGKYSYHLSKDRENIINCFSAKPVTF